MSPSNSGNDGAMTLDFSQLANAIARLDEIVSLYDRDPGNEVVRDALIQRFEFTYDLAHKSLRRALGAAAASPEEIEHMTFPTLIRTADEQALLTSDWTVWHRFREMRNITSHTYDQTKAMEVARDVAAFLDEVRPLPDRLRALESR